MVAVILLYIFDLLVAFFTIQRSRYLYNTYWNHYLFYNAAWLILIFLSINFNNYLVPVSNDVYIIFLVSLMFFNSTIVFIKKRSLQIKVQEVVLNLKVRRYVEVIVIMALLPQAFINFKLIKAGIPLYQLNIEYWREVRVAGAYMYLQFQELFLFPMALVLISSMFYDKYNNYSNKQYLITILIGIIIACCYFLISGGGRAEIMILFFVIVLSFLAKSVKELKLDIKLPSRTIVIGVLFALVVIIQFANEGRGKDGSFIQNAIEGYIIFAPLFETYLNSDIMFNYTYGASMFEGIVLLLQYPLKIIGISIYDVTINTIIQEFVFVPQYAKEYNNQVSALFVYMRDFGYLGIVLGPIITAFIYNFLYKICRKNSFLFLLYFTYIMRLCGTNLNYQINKVFIFAMIYAFIFVRISSKNTYSNTTVH